MKYDEPYLLAEGLGIPDPPTRLGIGRMTIQEASESCPQHFANVHPHIPMIPQALLDVPSCRAAKKIFITT